MEPGHEDRENDDLACECDKADEAAMEPGHEDRENQLAHARLVCHALAAMEPGHEDRENETEPLKRFGVNMPQWSPVTRTGKT